MSVLLEASHRSPKPETTTLVIRHGVTATHEYLLGIDPGFPQGESLSAAVIRRAYMSLVARGVVLFGDGLYHGDIHTFGMQDLLRETSSASAHEQGFHHVESKPGQKLYAAFGVRWDIDIKFKDARIYGPHSDPSNTLLLDLTVVSPSYAFEDAEPIHPGDLAEIMKHFAFSTYIGAEGYVSVHGKHYKQDPSAPRKTKEIK